MESASVATGIMIILEYRHHDFIYFSNMQFLLRYFDIASDVIFSSVACACYGNNSTLVGQYIKVTGAIAEP